jgi:hypothetical protein
MGGEQMDAEKRRRLVEHLDAIEEVRVKPLVEAGDRGVPAVTEATQIIDALALSYAPTKGSGSDKWRAWTTRYMPDTLDVPAWYHQLRNLGQHNLSAGAGLSFVAGDADRQLHGSVHGGSTALHTAQFVDDTLDAYRAYRADALSDAVIGARALKHFDKFPPVRPIVFRLDDYRAVTASATSGQTVITRDDGDPDLSA